ncbi:hypothetical protein EYF80_062240 [Liparis tanakae]|uniref:Uncharacterized protein n=1 Tax=Liparis tanakae TaxID=230148 RepID=A0A4Z2EGL5_9TELE|nr:hypothetical protein EYF80_062240 [Liparis tanakae]
MGLRGFWQGNKVLLVMVPSLALIHWGWYQLKENPQLYKPREEHIPEPGIVAYVSPRAAESKSVAMKPPRSWLRRNWLWAAGGAFLSVHAATWLMQSAVKGAVRSEAATRSEAAALRQRPAWERPD